MNRAAPARLAPAASAILALLLAGCAGRARPAPAGPERPVRSAELAELLARLQDASVPDAWSAEADLTVEDLVRGTTRSLGLRLAARKPDALRLQGTKPLLPTLFVLVANAEGVWLDVPTRRRTYVQPAGRPALRTDALGRTLRAFDAQEFLAGIVPDPPAPGESFWLEEEPRSYVLSASRCGPDGAHRPTRRITFEREQLELVAQRLYAGDGRVVSETRYRGRDPGSGLPVALRQERPFERVALSLELRRGRRGPAGEAAFRFTPPPGRSLVDVSLAAPAADAAELPTGGEGEP